MARMRLVFTCMVMIAGIVSAGPNVIELWDGDMPYWNGKIGEEGKSDKGHLRNVQIPAVSVYLPSEATGTGVVICPGGGYWVEAAEHEGREVAEWLNAFGVAGFVLKYRLPTSENVTDRSKVALADAQRAMRLVRHNAQKWNVEKLGIMGFSAGGHLASTAATHFDNGNPGAQDEVQRHSCRPDFAVLIYPVVTMDSTFTHMGSRRALLGENPTPQQVEYYSNEKQVTDKTPPAFLVHTTDDGAVPVENSIYYYLACRNHGVPAEMHIYQRGKHGFGLNRETGPVLSWPERCKAWMGENALLGKVSR